jgi:hypothetical protein
MLAPATGEYSIWVLSLSTICKTMCGMSAGATKGRITQHFARENGNMADLTAKESTQETLVSLLGMMGGVFVARRLEHAPTWVTWWMFWVLTALHVWANYKGVMILNLATLNPERTQVLLKDTIQTIADDYNAEIRSETNGKAMKDFVSTDQISTRLRAAMEDLPSPDHISESLLSSLSTLFSPTLLVSRPLDPRRLDCLNVFQREKYVLGHGGGRYIYIWLCMGATKRDELQAYVHAMLVRALLDQGKAWNSDLVQRYGHDLCLPCRSTVVLAFLSTYSINLTCRAFSIRSFGHVQKLFDHSPKRNLMDCLEEKGWDLQSRLYLGFSSGRILWSSSSKEE